MYYSIEFKPKSIKDLKKIQKNEQLIILQKIESLLEDFEDLIELRKAKKSELHMKGKSLSDIKKMLKIN